MIETNKMPPQNLPTSSTETEYQPPAITEVFQLEALATTCTDTNAKSDVGLGCNPGALFS